MSHIDFSLGSDLFFVIFLQITFDSYGIEVYVPKDKAVLIKRLIDREICWKMVEDGWSLHGQWSQTPVKHKNIGKFNFLYSNIN